MKITIDQAALAAAVTTAARFANQRSPLPILHTIRIAADDVAQELTLHATNLDTGVTVTTTAAHVEEPGAICVEGRLLEQIAKNLPSGEARLETLGEGRCVLTCGASKFELGTLPAEEYPSQPTADEVTSVTLSQPVLKGLLAQATVAAANAADESRAIMTGVCVSLNLDRLTMVSTDGRRLAVVTEVVEVRGVGEELQAVIPADALRELAKVLSAKTGTVQIATTARSAKFSLPGYEFHCRLLEGRFPDHTKVWPKDFERSAKLEASDLAAAVKRLLPVAQEKKSPNLLRLQFTEHEVIVTANTPDLGSGEERVPCVLTGEGLCIGFNGKYLAEALSVLDPTAEIEIDLQTELKSAILRIAGDHGFEYVLMPVKLRDVAEDYERTAA